MTEMSRIHPTVSKSEAGGHAATSECTTEWTVWKRSSMAFEGSDGFSVFDSEGRLAFRVDNYSRRHKYLSGELLLMDGDGRALMALRPQILSMHDRWNGLRSGEDGPKAGSESQVFTMRRRSILQHGDEAEVFMGESTAPDFWTEGCFRVRRCNIRGSAGEEVAQISRKRASSSVVLADDVFSLVIQPGVDCPLMMAFVVVMDRICQKAQNPFTALMCSGRGSSGSGVITSDSEDPID